MRVIIGIALASGIITSSQGQPAPSRLPNVTLDCYQAFSTVMELPQSFFRDIAIDGDNFERPIVRYRLQVVDSTILKVIKDPSRAALRSEHGVHISEMTRDFTNKHNIIGWREAYAGGARLYTVSFDDHIFSIANVPLPEVRPPTFQLEVMKCREVSAGP